MAPNWYTEMPIITQGPGIVMLAAIWWVIFVITKLTREDLRARRQERNKQ